jgi:hypothetical protein
MALGLLKKIQIHRATDVAAMFSLSDGAKAALTTEVSSGDFLETLVKHAHWTDAVRFLAHALPPRETVWWACTCARATLPKDAAPEVVAALQAAEAWVFRPSEENRRAAMQKAETAGFDTPSAWSAVSVFWSGGSMAPPGAPPVAPAERLCATAATSSIILAAVQTEPQLADEKYKRFLDVGIDVANGGSGRPSPQATPGAA